MADYVYTTVPGKMKELLQKLRQVGVPPKATGQWIKSIGFKSSNDATMLGVLKFIGFVDGSGIPTSVWSSFRGAKYKAVLGEAIRKGYADLFAVYPDAHNRSNTDLSDVFSTSSSGGQQVIAKTVQTFKALVDEAEFSDDASSASELTMSSGPLHTPPAAGAKAPAHPTAGGPEVHIDIQIHISPEANGDQIDKIFQSMAKHLYGRDP